MAETKQVKEEQLEQIKQLQDTFNDMVLKFGQLEIEIIKVKSVLTELETKKEEFNKEFFDLRVKETELANQLSGEYGEGIINPSTGEFVSQSPSENQQN